MTVEHKELMSIVAFKLNVDCTVVEEAVLDCEKVFAVLFYTRIFILNFSYNCSWSAVFCKPICHEGQIVSCAAELLLEISVLNRRFSSLHAIESVCRGC